MWWRRNTTWSQYSWCTVSMSFYFEKESVRAAKNEHSARKTFVLQQCIMHHSLNKVNSYQRLNKTHPGCWQFPTRFSMHHYLSACGKRRIIQNVKWTSPLSCTWLQHLPGDGSCELHCLSLSMVATLHKLLKLLLSMSPEITSCIENEWVCWLHICMNPPLKQ